MPYSCTTCYGDIREPWDGELTDEPHLCEMCNHPVCWDCKEMDVRGKDFCGLCAVKVESDDSTAFAHGA